MTRQKNSFKMNVVEGNTISEKESDNVELFEKNKAEGSKIENIEKPALIISTVDYPITIKYGDKKIRLSGRARESIADWSKLPETLPTGVSLKKL